MNIILRYTSYLFAACWLIAACSPLLAKNISPREIPMSCYCKPCGSDCDLERHEKPGNCQDCGMPLIEGTPALSDSLMRTEKQAKKRNVAIFIHNGVEILDFAGPSEVFASTDGFNVYTVSLSEEPIISQGFIKVTPNYSLTDCPKPDIVVLPGGDTGPFIENKQLIDWIKNASTHAEVMLSVCTGAGLLAKAGLLDGKQATTFHSYIKKLQRATPKAKILSDTRFVDNGQIVTTAGVSAGIDGALHVVARLKGQAMATQTARYMEYDKWKPDEGLIVKPSEKGAAENK
ncbi:DJ-1/PfpI family protein [Dyadobacter pollutisoli]|uniref:DJ-1/PfpI family protein n=1 Tax=Dyadobacter pollutisoli TaxID=2910158 RepID=A0A9E8SN42_9BACT|nr:DJ-1/PfpI family protein [Dyadobacter pollutisoli]WAC13396.1 DJ-1/PfpI family protein [Dyadobacter pollutisoli]